MFKNVIATFNERSLPELIERSLEVPRHEKIITISGVRRSGKTFLFYQLISQLMQDGVPKERIVYVNFEDDRLFPLSFSDLQDLIDAYYEMYPSFVNEQKYFFLDEVQEIEHWQKFVRRLHDTERVSLYITGSSSKLMSSEVPTALRGRTLTYTLFPMDFHEFLRFKGVQLQDHYAHSSQRYLLVNSLIEYIDYGSFPEVIKEPELKTKMLQDYYDLVIFRDIVERHEIRNTYALKAILKYLLTNVSNLFSLNKYLKMEKPNIQVSKNTLSDYVSYIIASGLVYFVPIYSHSLKVQQVNPVKVYCIDTGLRNAVSLKFSGDLGRLVENIVFVELLRRGFEIFYWKQTHEVDFVVKDRMGDLYAFNVSYTNEVLPRESEGIREVEEELPIKQSLIVTRDLAKTMDGVTCIPLWRWLLDKTA